MYNIVALNILSNGSLTLKVVVEKSIGVWKLNCVHMASMIRFSKDLDNLIGRGNME